MGSVGKCGKRAAGLVGDGRRDIAEARDVPERLGVRGAVGLLRGHRGIRDHARALPFVPVTGLIERANGMANARRG